MIRRKPFVLAVLVTVAMAGVARAQERPGLRPHHFTAGGGVMWSGGYDIGQSAIQLRGNGPGTAPPPFTLLTVASRVTPAAAPELRVGFAITRRVALEAGVALSRPRIAVAIAADPEAPAQELPGEQLQQYLLEGGVSWQLPVDMGTRLAPFVSTGAGYLRQLHEDRTLAETGQHYYAGGGARYWLHGGGDTKALGVRGDARVNIRRKGIDFEDTVRVYPSFSLSVFVGF